MVGCSAYGCTNRSEKGFSLKSFPVNPTRRAIWIAAVNRENWSPSLHSRLCEVHFEADQFEKPDAEGKIKLKNNAVPTLFVHKKPPKIRPPPKSRAPLPKKRKIESVVLENEREEELIDQVEADDSERVAELKRKLKKVQDENRKLRSKLSVLNTRLNSFLRKDQFSALTRKNTQGMLWSKETVKKALQLKFSCGTAGYDCLLKQNFPLPSTRTLRRRLGNINFRSGILDDVVQLLEIKASTMDEKEKHCTLVLDEMAIRSSTEFDITYNEFIGNITLEGPSGVANHGLVFMLAGISSRWKQCIAYHFTGNSCLGTSLKNVILDIISRVEPIGLKVCCAVNDMGGSNLSMWKAFNIICGQHSRTKNFITHPMDENRKLYFMADVPHLLKNLRNMLVTHRTFEISPSIVQKYGLSSDSIDIKHIEHTMKLQEHMDLKLEYKLNSEDLEAGHFNKMKVSTAKKIFNHSLSAAMQYLVSKNKSPDSHKTTAWFIQTVDRWFTVMTSRHPVVALSEENPVAYMEAIQCIKDFDEIISSLKIGPNGGAWKPVQSGVRLACATILDLQEYFLHSQKFSFLLTSRFTQDCLENFFSSIRAKQPVPSALQFQRNLKLVSIAQYMKNPSSSNYEGDDSSFFGEFLDLKKTEEQQPIITLPSEWNTNNQTELCIVEKDCLKHIIGYVLSRVKNNDVTCDTCVNSVLSTEKATTDLSFFKNYKPDKLLIVNSACFDFFLKAEMLFRYIQENSLWDKQNVSRYVIQAIQERVKFDVELPNCHQIKQKLIRRYVNFRLQIYAQKQRRNIKQVASFGSKSICMRNLVSKIK